MEDQHLNEITVLHSRLRELESQLDRIQEENGVLTEAQRISGLGIWKYDIIANRVTWSEEVYQIYEMTSGIDQPRLEDIFFYANPQEKEKVESIIQDAIKTGNSYSMDCTIVTKNKTIKYLRASGQPYYNSKKQLSHLVGTVYDISEMKRLLLQVEELKNQLEKENYYLRQEIKLEHNFEEIITTSARFKKVLQRVEQVADANATVLILGESGTGKELLARAIHNLSKRKERPLIKVNCAALPAQLIESELFGHEKGAFTGAIAKKIGKFELAHQGTIFLDEIGELPLDLQAKLLRVLQDGEFERLGGNITIRADIRVIAATNRNLDESIRNGTFREDLFYRLNVFPIYSIPLRERKEDIPPLIEHFVKKYAAELQKDIEKIPQKVMQALQTYNWPGNIRELSNIIERAIIVSSGNSLEFGEWVPHNTAQAVSRSKLTLQQLEKNYIIEVLEITNWRVSGDRGAAKILGLNSKTLDSKMRKLKITRSGKNSSI